MYAEMSLAHFDTYCPLQDKDKYKYKDKYKDKDRDKDKYKDKDRDKDKYKDKIIKRPNICYVFEKLRVQRYQV